MKHWYPLLIAVAGSLAATTPAGGQSTVVQHGIVGHYTARLSARDHFNSNGQRLTTVAAIIRQDRANVHRFGRIDPEDQGDPFFHLQRHRLMLEQMIQGGRVSRSAANTVINGEPLIHVDIYDGWIEVTIL